VKAAEEPKPVKEKKPKASKEKKTKQTKTASHPPYFQVNYFTQFDLVSC
jgi:histone H1/5